MTKRSKKHRAFREKMPEAPVGLKEAISFLKENPGAKFDESVEVAIRLGIDPRKSDQAVRGVVGLPHGTGKNVKVLVFASGTQADAARSAGADYVGMSDMAEKIKEGWTDFDVAVSTPEAMKEVKKLGRVLGPRGLMPNPKTGTVTEDVVSAVKDSKAGKVEFRADKQGIVSAAVGKLSFDADHLVNNAEVLIGAVKAERPAGMKGTYIRTCTVATTMGAGLRVNA
ncbi:MAG: 50S ribosomal protein L1 [Kiritimatiellia bacterium]